jgi:outer membrane biosynthesis protein TonB
MLPLALAAQMAFFAGGCSIFRRPRHAPPPPPVAQPVPDQTPPAPAPSEPVVVPPEVPPPVIEAPRQEPPVVPPPPPVVPEAPKPKPRRKTVRRPAEPAPPPAEPKPEAPAVPPAPPPRLGEVLTAEQRRDLAAQLEANVAEARRILAALAGRPQTRAQRDTAARVRAFLAQALEMSDSDIGTAVELSRRALLLARDLAGAVR